MEVFSEWADLEGKTVLVVDDDSLLRGVIAKVLRREGYVVLEAPDGPTAIDLVVTEKPDIVLLDVMMSDMSGYEVCQHIRRIPLLSNIPIILLTALNETGDKIRGMTLGADDYITKPFNANELLARLEMHLRRTWRDVQSNPLTSLPGNRAIEMALRSRIASGEPLAVCYIDIDDFKPYNDKYGFVTGDDVLLALSRCVLEAVHDRGSVFEDFVGHEGGDDFVVLTAPERAEAIARRIITSFDEQVPSFYNDEDRERGYMVGKDRRGNIVAIPMVSVSIAIVTNLYRPLVHPRQAAQIAAEVKQRIKAFSGSNYGFDLRQANGRDEEAASSLPDAKAENALG
jgi:diguanylate cyclase (GGDEF)-like protein